MDKCISAVHLARWIEGTLGDADQESVASHISKCDDCRRAVGLAIVAEETPASAISPVEHARALATVLGTGSVCADVNLWSKWVENTITDEERAGVNRHLAECDDCRRTVALSRIAGESAAPAMTDTARRRVLNVVMPPKRVAWTWQVAAAAAVVFGVGLYFILRPPAPQNTNVVKTGGPSSPSTYIEPKKDAPVDAPKPEQPRPPDPEPPKRESPKVDPPKEHVKSNPPVDPPQTPKQPIPVYIKPESSMFAKVAVSDAKGLAIERAGASKIEPFAGAGTVGFGDTLIADAGGALMVDGQALVVLERSARVSVMTAAAGGSYAMLIQAGQAYIDTAGASQEWDLYHSDSGVSLTKVNGRLSVDATKGALTVGLVAGAANAKMGAAPQAMVLGATITLTERGFEKGTVDADKAVERIRNLKPETVTLFAADFGTDGVKITSGRWNAKKPGFLEAGTGGPTDDLIWAGVKFAKPIPYEAGTMLSIRFRSSHGTVAIWCDGFMRRLGRHNSGGTEWESQELPLHGLEKGGSALDFGSMLSGISFGVAKGEWLEIDEIKITRRLE